MDEEDYRPTAAEQQRIVCELLHGPYDGELSPVECGLNRLFVFTGAGRWVIYGRVTHEQFLFEGYDEPGME